MLRKIVLKTTKMIYGTYTPRFSYFNKRVDYFVTLYALIVFNKFFAFSSFSK
jgi:hypothetical protein